MSPDDSEARSPRKVAFGEGFRLRREGSLEAGAEVLRRALEEYPDYAPGWTALGDVLYEMSHYNEAAESFRHAVRLRPDSDLVSGGLFHALVDAGDIDGATAEAERFLGRHRNGAACDPDLLTALVSWLSEPENIADGLRRRKS